MVFVSFPCVGDKRVAERFVLFHAYFPYTLNLFYLKTLISVERSRLTVRVWPGNGLFSLECDITGI